MNNFSQEEIANIIKLMVAGAKTMNLDGTGMIVVGALMKKVEDLMKPKVEEKTAETEPEISSKKQKND